MRRIASALSCLVLLLGGMVLAQPAAASDTSIDLPAIPTGQMDFRHLVVDDSAGYVFLSTANGIEVRDLAGGVVISLALGSTDGLALSADGGTLYAALPADHAIAVIDTGTLAETARITTDSNVLPRTLALTGSMLWFGYEGPVNSFYGGIGVADLSQPNPTATVPAPIVNDTGTAVWWHRAPALTSSAVLPDTLFAGDQSGGSSRPVEKFSASGTTLTVAAVSSALDLSAMAAAAVTADGADLLVPAAGWRVERLRTSDLASDGYLPSNTPMVAVAVAPDDGRIAFGNGLNADQPAVYTFTATGAVEYQYAYQPYWGASEAGLAYNSTGSTLYAVTQSWDSSAPGGWRFRLHVITNTHDTARPPAPEVLTATPDFRSINLTWNRLGLYDPAKVDSFTVYRGTAPDQLTAYARPAATQAAAQSWVDTGAAAGTRYYYAVTASNAGGESDRTATASAIRNDLATVFVTGEYAAVAGDRDLAYLSDHGWHHRITATGGNYSDPAAAPDGNTVAYARTDSSGTHLWRIPLAGGTAHQLTSGSGADSWPTWSPDSASIAFTRTTAAGTSIWTVPAAGGLAVQVPGSIGDRQPAWSPNGRLLAVTDGTGSASRIVVTSLDGGYRRAVSGTNGDLPIDRCYWTNGLPPLRLCHYSGAGASWAPDGASLVFLQTTSGGTATAIVPAAGGPVDYSLYQPYVDTRSVFWSPDGSRIVGSEEPGGPKSDLWQVAPDGTARTRIGWDGTWADHPSVTAARSAYLPLSHPSPVTGVTAALGTGAVALRWTRPADTGYVIIRRSAAGGAAPATPDDGVAVYTGAGTAATATGLVNGATYRFSIFSVSPLGDVGASSTVTAVPGAVPSVSPNGSVLAALYGIGPGFTASWGRALPAGQVYDVQLGSRTFNATTRTWSVSPAWAALLTGTTRTSQVVKATAGTTYYLRSRIRDSYGNASAWSAGAIAPVPYDDRSAARTSGWTEAGATGRYLAGVSTAHQAGSALQWHTYGSGFDLVTDRCAGCGQYRVYVDGVLRSTVDTGASTTLVRQTTWRMRYAGIGLHTVRVVVVGTPGRPSVRVDALVAIR